MSNTRESARRSARQHPEELVKKLLQTLGGRFSTSLGINLASGDSEEIFKWFLASILFGARIGEKIAASTYREFERRGVLAPQRILDTGWGGLVEILDDMTSRRPANSWRSWKCFKRDTRETSTFYTKKR